MRLIHTRETDLTHDFYRCGGFHQLRGALDASGKLSAWHDHHISFGSGGKIARGAGLSPEAFPGPLIQNFRLSQSLIPSSVPTGYWRAPGACADAWVLQSFLHELSTAAGRDHVSFLLELLGPPRWLPPANENALHTGRAAGVIRMAAEKSGWGTALPVGHGRGIAFHFCHRGHVAEAVELSVDAQNRLRVHKVVAVCDVGPVVNRSGAENQVEGSIVDGLSAMWLQGISFEAGRVAEANFNDYGLLRYPASPDSIECHFIESDFPPTGLGEPALPPLAPAVCNALFAATGRRIRRLPLVKEGFVPK